MSGSPDEAAARRPHIVILTAGGAGMFCGSCLHDNTWARVLQSAGYDISLIPTYTPIRVDEENVSLPHVFFGGINVYLNSKWPWWRRLPAFLKRGLDYPVVIRGLTRFSVSTQASELGQLTCDMLAGETGPHRAAIDELAAYIRHLQPDVVLFTNALLSGALRGIRDASSAQMLCILQGDDIFLEGLIEPYKSRVLEQVGTRAAEFDGFVVHSRYYRDFMSGYLKLPAEKFHVVPLTIDCRKHDGRPKPQLSDPPVIGYFARICEEKGLHQLVEAALKLRLRMPECRIRAAGYLSADRKPYLESVRRLAAPLGPDFEYVGSPDTHAEKVAFLNSLDVLSVPTVYREPKGIYLLEAWANGIPVVQPRHGAFPELVESTGGGILYSPGDQDDLVNSLETLLVQPETRRRHAEAGWSHVRAAHDFSALAAASDALFKAVLGPRNRP